MPTEKSCQCAKRTESTTPTIRTSAQIHHRAGVVAAFGPLEGVVRCLSAFDRVIPIRNRVAGRGGSALRRAVPVGGAVPVRRQLALFPDDDRIQPAGVLAERLP